MVAPCKEGKTVAPRPETLAEALERAMADDEDYRDYKLRNLYLAADTPGRAWIDCAMINLCGWSLPTLAKHCGQKLPHRNSDNPFMIVDTIRK